MEYLSSLDLIKLYEEYKLISVLTLMLIFAVPIIYVSKLIINLFIKKFVETKLPTYNTIFIATKLYQKAVKLLFLMYIIFCSELIDNLGASKIFLRAKDIFVQIYSIVVIAWLAVTFFEVIAAIYRKKSAQSKIPISLYLQIFKIIITICAVLAIVSTGMGLSISSLFTSLGAAAALLGFVFRDALIALLSSLQVTSQDILRIGDWVTVANKDIDGTVEKITITIVVVRNFDGTTTTVPTATFLQNPVRNWRPMYEKGGRRIKRSIVLDMDYIKNCDQKLLTEIKSLPAMQQYAESNLELFNTQTEISNITLFRYYISEYLTSHQGIHKDGFTFLVRQLDPTPNGLPIELYIFTKDTRWNEHEVIQAGIFEHLLSVLPKFGLKTFQTVIYNKH